MSDYASVFEQLRQGFSQHVNNGTATNAMAIAFGVLLVGVVISSLGAKFARLGITGAFIALGLYGGYHFGVSAGFQPALCAAIGACMVGVISFLTFRLWMGVATGLVLASISLGGFSYDRVLPHAQTFKYEATNSQGFSVPTPAGQQAYQQRNVDQYLQDLRSHVKGHDATAERDGQLLAVGTFLTGVLLGVIAVRWMAILSTSLVGTILVSAASLAILAQMVPSAYQALASRPTVAGIAMGAFLVSSLIVQLMVTRKAAAPEKS